MATHPPPKRKRISGLGLNMLIANAHQLTTQMIGVILSASKLLAIAVSMLSIVAGIVSFAASRFAGEFIFIGIAACIGAGLALLIEGLTLGALTRIRLADMSIKKIDASIEEEQDKLYVLSDRKERAVKQKGLRQKRKRLTRHARQMRFWSGIIATIGSITSAVAGGLFYHTVLAGLGAWESSTVAALFPFVVTCTFVSSELFKGEQEQAIREGFTGGGLSDAALKEETRRLSFQAVSDGIMTHFSDPEIQAELKQETLGMLRDIVSQLRITEVNETPLLLPVGTVEEVSEVESGTPPSGQREETTGRDNATVQPDGTESVVSEHPSAQSHLGEKDPPGQQTLVRDLPAVPVSEGVTNENGTDKLALTLEFFKAHPEIVSHSTEEAEMALAAYLGLRRPGSARFWKVKALELLQKESPAKLAKRNTEPLGKGKERAPQKEGTQSETRDNATESALPGQENVQDNGKRIAEYQAGHPEATRQEIAEALRVSIKTVSRYWKKPGTEETGQSPLRIVQ